VLIAALLSTLLISSQGATSCETAEVCRAQALIAHAKGDFESFHDFAWAAYRKAKPNDPELMLLIARAQSLSGRPGDALVMLERVAAQGKIPPDLSTDPEFARVRALPRWEEVGEALLTRTGEVTEGTAPSAPAKVEPKRAPAKPAPPVPEKPEPAKVESKPAPKTERPKSEPAKPSPAKGEVPKSVPAKPEPAKPEPPESEAAKAETPKPPARTPGSPLKFTTALTPTALAYDRVSKRYIIGDRRARRIAVIDENTGQVSTLVGALGALGDVDGIAIDAQQGDLWVVTSGEDGASLSKMQLISGRVLSTVQIRDLTASVVSLSFVPGAGLVAADSEGILWSLRPAGRVEKLSALEYVPKALGSDGRGRLYVSAGGPRLARFAMGPFRRLGTVELDSTRVPDGPFVVVADRVETIVGGGEGYELVSSTIK
jgi:hypothetical protein